jgi:tRNA (adenine37-N6)-methyltransferase
MAETFKISPIGYVYKKEAGIYIDIDTRYKDALLGLEGFSHINVLFWFHENDQPQKRATLQVNPRRDPQNPITGVFATHSPLRPNLIGLTICRVLSIDGTRIYLNDIDAIDQTPVIDIKCHIPTSRTMENLKLPNWV